VARVEEQSLWNAGENFVFVQSFEIGRQLTEENVFLICSVPRRKDDVNTESAKKMYTHFNRWYLCIVFEVELK
jgi:hypothetical protein